MTYGEIVNKITAHERIKAKDIPGTWFFYLLQDGVIKQISFHGNIYEINFIPSAPISSGLFIVDDKLCKTGDDAVDMLATIIRGVVDGLNLYIVLDEEYFEIKLELLESNE